MFGPLTSKPGTSKNNKTGSWRVSAKPKFLQKNCIGCRICAIVCPEGCVSGDQKRYDVDLLYCKGCGNCALVCPKKDIQMIKEEQQ